MCDDFNFEFEKKRTSYIKTFWKSTLTKHKYSVFAIVRQYENRLIAWELEMRGSNIYHPGYGVMSRNSINDVDIFAESAGNKTPSFAIDLADGAFYFAGDTLNTIT